MNFKYLFIILLSWTSFAQNIDFPSAKVDSIVKRIQIPVIPSYQINVLKLGAKGDSVTDNKKIFDKAMALCKKNNGGTIIVPKGIYKINGPIHFVSNVNLKIEKGAKIKFSDNPKDYLPMVLTSWEGTMLYNYSPLIYANNCSNIAISGEGTIDGEGGK
ncbi:MAG TPA: glycosyl hydrolase family 28-related protein, partial [Flavobacterium sp.]|nr:glycosyl hydrolase family 28-related protein [Flavobacterium sp.]